MTTIRKAELTKAARMQAWRMTEGVSTPEADTAARSKLTVEERKFFDNALRIYIRRER